MIRIPYKLTNTTCHIEKNPLYASSVCYGLDFRSALPKCVINIYLARCDVTDAIFRTAYIHVVMNNKADFMYSNDSNCYENMYIHLYTCNSLLQTAES